MALGLLLAPNGSNPQARAADEAWPIVAGFERFYARGESPAEFSRGGELLIGELGCVACHQGTETPLAPVSRKQAPILDRVGARVKPDYLRTYLADPRKAKPGTTMPHVLAGLPAAEAEATVDALVHFLATTGSTTETQPNRKQITPGQTLFEQSGCVACHGGGAAAPERTGSVVPMGNVPSKYTFTSLTSFLLNPLNARPSGRMPGMGFRPQEAQAVASYLLRDVHIAAPPNLAYRYYEGSWQNLPDLDGLQPAATGLAEGFDVGVARRHNEYALRFEGVFEADRAGDYTFHLASDDGSRLFVDGKLVVDNDGIHPNQEASGRLALSKGRHRLVVTYFQGGGEDELEVRYEGPGLNLRDLGPVLLPPEGTTLPAATKLADRFVVDPAKAEKGRALFVSVGCASCHQLREKDQPIAARPASKPLASLRPDAGCLAENPPQGVPQYQLSPRQRAAIIAALASPARPATDREAIARTMLAFNCYACHQRDGIGGVEEGLNPSFATSQPEMGDEGRIPPLLTGVGGKLTETWLRNVLANGAKDRPYMKTRMPRFGEANVGHLVGTLARVDALEAVPVPDFAGLAERRIKANGRFLVGGQAFNCGSCHTFRDIQAAGIQAIDMTTMSRRLRRDWFTRYVVNPPAFRPGTRMPTAWPDGKSMLDSVYNGDTARQVESVWQYLSDGPRAAVPYGLGRDPIPLVADKTPVLYRNFIEGAGPRAIGVGYPEKANLAFDANDLRLALIWQGAFIDAGRHWNGRGEGFQGPLGDNILPLPAGPAFAPLASGTAEWPVAHARELGEHFRGYRITPAGRPVFLYEAGGVMVEDLPEPVPGGDAAGLKRTLELTAGKAVDGLYFRAAVGRKIEALADGWFAIDGEWKLRITADVAPGIRESAGKKELIVPIKLDGGKTRIVEQFAW